MHKRLIHVFIAGLLFAYFSVRASGYYPEAFSIVSFDEPICFTLYVSSIYFIPTITESHHYNDIEKMLLQDLSNIIILYDLPIIINEKKKDYSNCNVILSFTFKYNNLAASAYCCGYPYYTSLRLVIKPKQLLDKSSPLAVLDYIMIWESGDSIDLTTSTDRFAIYNLAREKMRSSIELFAIFYKRARSNSNKNE